MHLAILFGLFLASLSMGAVSKNESDKTFQTIEFQGAMQIQDTWQFSFRDTESQLSFWLKLGNTRRGLTPLAYDKDTTTLTIKHHGKKYPMKLAKAEDTPLAVVKSEAQKQTNPRTKEYTIPEAPSFSPPPPPPNSGRPPSVAPPSKLPPQPKF